jgi:plasmid stabilization system protein ParE
MSNTPLRIVLRPRVADDMERQVAYLDEHATQKVGDRYLAAVNEAFEQLAEMPGMGAPRDTLSRRLRGLRM